VVVSAHVSPSDRKPAFLPVMVARNVQQVAGGSRQPVEPRHHHHVISLKLIEHPAKLRSVGLGSADMHIAENLSASRLGQLPRLRLNARSTRLQMCLRYVAGVQRIAAIVDRPHLCRDLGVA
jgi:hypothetical protein